MSRRILSICILLGLLLLSLAAITSQGSAQTLTPTVIPTSTACPNLTITGQVYDMVTMKGIAGATVDVVSYMGQDFNATTAADGTYSLPVVGISNYACTLESISATAPGYQPYTVSVSSAELFAQPVRNFGMLSLATPTRTPTVTPVGTNNDVPGPDLTISSITYVGSSPACMNSPKDNVVVSNIGTVAAGTFVVSFNSLSAQTVNGLGAGQSVTLIINAGGTITATADSTGLIAETNESNNSLTVNLPAPTQAHTCTPTSGPSLTPTRTPTGPTPTRTRTPTAGLTPTRTPTCPCFSITPTRTLTITFTPPPGGVCSPVTGTIAAPFTYDGAGDLCWQSTNLGSYINSWNLTTLTINGVDVRNIYTPNTSLPPLINGYWYVHYVSAVSYGHFEAK